MNDINSPLTVFENFLLPVHVYETHWTFVNLSNAYAFSHPCTCPQSHSVPIYPTEPLAMQRIHDRAETNLCTYNITQSHRPSIKHI
jgi:hypothetical protein